MHLDVEKLVDLLRLLADVPAVHLTALVKGPALVVKLGGFRLVVSNRVVALVLLAACFAA